MYPELIIALSGILPVSDPVFRQFSLGLKMLKVPRGKVLLSEGDVCDKLWFVKSGLVRGYRLVDNGSGNPSDITEWFARENEFFQDAESFVNQVPSHEYIETLETSTLVFISRNDLYALYDQYPEIRCLGRIIAERGWFAQKQLIHEMRFLTAAQKLESFRKRSGNLFHRVPQKHIASYLGISENYVSKLRAKR